MLPLRPPFQAILLLQRPIISRPSSAQETPLIFFFFFFFNVFSSSIFSDFGSISAPKTQFFCENLFPKPLFQAKKKKKKKLFPRPFFWKPVQHRITENDLNYLPLALVSQDIDAYLMHFWFSKFGIIKIVAKQFLLSWYPLPCIFTRKQFYNCICMHKT